MCPRSILKLVLLYVFICMYHKWARYWCERLDFLICIWQAHFYINFDKQRGRRNLMKQSRFMLTWEHIQFGRRGPMKMKQGGLLNWQSKKVSNTNPVSSHTICPSSHKSTWKYIQCSQCPVASASSIREASPPPKKTEFYEKKIANGGRGSTGFHGIFLEKDLGTPPPSKIDETLS